MRRTGMLALAIVLVVPVLLARSARADGIYFSEAFGGTRYDNELSSFVDGAVRIRVALGYRAKRVAVEAFFGGDMADEGYAAASEPDLVTYGIDAKYLFPVTSHLEVYLRGSISRAEVDEYDSAELSGYGGRGLGIGTGVQLKGKTPVVALLFWPAAVTCAVTRACKNLGPEATVAVFLDQGYDFYRLHGGGSRAGYAVDGEATRWTLGFAAGSDF